MPELAEAEFFRKRWTQAARPSPTILRVHTHDAKKLFRTAPAPALRAALTDSALTASAAAGKQILFRFQRPATSVSPAIDAWLGIHLGMTGDLSVAPPAHTPRKHDHLVLYTTAHALVFADPRLFGRIQFHLGPDAPLWWAKIAPALISPSFTVAAAAAFLNRRARAPIKAVLLMQERFPGIGNWMADEILWRAAIHPAQPAGSLRPAEVKTLWRECRAVARLALATIAGRGDDLPLDLNTAIPDTWLFNHRWSDGGRCPKTKKNLSRADIGGRTTCWSPARQKLRKN
ncbi:MAG: DNA-formamidopyrimidine glycosylase [Opitutia bacterium]|nr:MAG: DNA-formamidopyrimidine glycosylase [Opitutae bacterium]